MPEIVITNTGGAALLQDGDRQIRFATTDGTPIQALLDALSRYAEQRKTPTLGAHKNARDDGTAPWRARFIRLLAEGMRFQE